MTELTSLFGLLPEDAEAPDWSANLLKDRGPSFQYAGIGARSTPHHIREVMTSLASQLEDIGLILRSGGATGADEAFEAGVKDPLRKEIYLPWLGFNRRYTREPGVYIFEAGAMSKAEMMAQMAHPAWDTLSQGVRKLMGRNSYQLGGLTMDLPSDFVICWTPEGSGVGGTGQAIRLAKMIGIPVFDLGEPDTDAVFERLNACLAPIEKALKQRTKA